MKPLLTCLVLALAACNTTTDTQDAMNACSVVSNSHLRDVCMMNYVNNARIGRDAEWSAAGAAFLSDQPARRTCMNIGGIVTCQ